MADSKTADGYSLTRAVWSMAPGQDHNETARSQPIMAESAPPADPGLTKALWLILHLEQPVLAKLLQQLQAPEVLRIMQQLESAGATERPSEEQMRTVAREFLQAGSNASTLNMMREAMALAFGGQTAEQMLRLDHWRTIAARVPPQALTTMLQDEQPQTLAIVLSHLPPRYSAEVLAGLPEELRAQTVTRIAETEGVSPPTLDAVLRAIETNLAGHASFEAGKRNQGVQRAAAVLSQLDGEVAGKIIQAIREGDAARASAIEQEMFSFQDLFRLDGRTLQTILAAARPERLALALKGLSADQQQAIFSALPEVTVKSIREELEAMGPVPVRDVRAARRELTTLAMQLEREGKITVRAAEEMVA